MEHKIGEQFKFKSVTLEVVEVKEGCCIGCYFHSRKYGCKNMNMMNNVEDCLSDLREDLKDVIFKKVS